jgi:hypothetical protein
MQMLSVITNIVSACVELFSKLLSAGATVFAACVAIYGINAWRSEFKGKRDIELAEEVLELFYKAKDAIRAIRNPWSLNEGQKVIERLRTEGKEGDIDIRVATVLERYEKYEEVFQKLQTLQYRFMARFGKDKIKPFDDLLECINNIFIAAGSLFDLQESIKEEMDAGVKKSLRDEMVRLKADLWWLDHKKDRITPKVETAVKAMEEICQKIIEGR